MSVYMIIEISRIHEPAAYAEYVDRVPAIIERFGGRYVVRTSQVVRMSGEWRPERLIVLEFPAFENVRQFTASAEYQELAPLRERSTESRSIAVEGC